MSANIDLYLGFLFFMGAVCFLVLCFYLLWCFYLHINDKLDYAKPTEEDAVPEDFAIQILVSSLDYGAIDLESKAKVEQELQERFNYAGFEQKELVWYFVELLKKHHDVDWNILKENVEMLLVLNKSMQSENECVGSYAIRIRIVMDVLYDLQASLDK